MGGKVAKEEFLVGQPRGPCHEDTVRVADKALHQGQLLARLPHLEHAVETGVAHNLHLVDAYRREQLATLLVLDKEAAEAAQHAAILPSVGTEEDLTRAEDAAHAIGRHPAMV